MTKRNSVGAFTLIELSIVVLIIGLLIGGITAGTSLIKQAQLRAIMSDFSTYQVAYNNFRSRFDKLPGDLNSASIYWPSTTVGDSASCTTVSALNCNGNGNNRIEHGLTLGTNESLKAWKHLSLAGMISTSVEQITGSDGSMNVGTQTPESKRSGVGYMISGGGATSGNEIYIDDVGAVGGLTNPFGSGGTNALWVGRSTDQAYLAGGPNLSEALTPEEAFQIDQKMDDAKDTLNGFTGAWTGSVRSRGGMDESFPSDCTDLVGAVIVYNVANSADRQCIIGMRLE